MTNQTIQLAISITGSQKRLADLCGVAQPTVWRWLHGGGIDARYVMKLSQPLVERLNQQIFVPTSHHCLTRVILPPKLRR